MIDLVLILACGYFFWFQDQGPVPEPAMVILESASPEATTVEPLALEPVPSLELPNLQSDPFVASPENASPVESALPEPAPRVRKPSSAGH